MAPWVALATVPGKQLEDRWFAQRHFSCDLLNQTGSLPHNYNNVTITLYLCTCMQRMMFSVCVYFCEAHICVSKTVFTVRHLSRVIVSLIGLDLFCQ